MVLRVTLTIILFSIAIISLVGSALYTQLNKGIYKEKISASISDAQSIARATQIQMMFAQYQNRTQVTKVFSSILADPTIDGSTSGRDIAIFSPETMAKNLKFNSASNAFLPGSIPTEFRAKNRKATSTQYTLTTLYYKNAPSKNGLVVGHNLALDKGGNYEFYVVYTFDAQEVTMALVRNSLFIAGGVLIFLIGLITLVVTFRLIAPIKRSG
jgi:type II secretory pathway pseudopilin PulG